ncbi:hypothetical protein [Pectinatus frisingensis]|uniref:hypothetical protein n=1 Tax=Pectinatus frisingensis TaxID=865 RepID=UPI0018C7B034|nr:hypothetical protein [Pectinatus frisingensis]
MPKKLDIKPGDTFGYWAVLTYPDYSMRPPRAWCRCKCGTIKNISIHALSAGRTKSCGCRHKLPKIYVPKDYGIKKGDTFGYWTILKQSGKYFICKCICGNIHKVAADRLLNGRSLSCGCQRNKKRDMDNLQKGWSIVKKLKQAGTNTSYTSLRKINKNSETKITGVSLMKNGKYRAYIVIDRRQIYLGSYLDIKEAIATRKAAEEKYFRPKEAVAKEILKNRK